MRDKIIKQLKKLKKNIIEYIITNRLFLSYVILSLISVALIREYTIGDAFKIKILSIDLSIILILGSFGYLLKAKKQFNYFFALMIIYTIMGIVNTIYFKFYYSFASFGELAAAGQTESVMGSVFEKVSISDFIYIIFPILFYFIHKRLLKGAYYKIVSLVEKRKKMCSITLFLGIIILVISCINIPKYQFERLEKRWNRVAIVETFGVPFYHINDLLQIITPKFNSLFGYEEASKKFIEYFTNEEYGKYNAKNKYTGILKGKNIIFVHMEGMGTYLMDLEFNGKEATPNINELAKEGMFFSKFYPQISSGTSSDTEFTLLTSLMPAASGPVFTTYYNRDYITIPKLLKEKNYYTFSMHGNYASMWNRSNVHPVLGYEDMYFENSFTYTEDDVINLGINDELFFEQAIPILEKIEQENKNYMGTIITLSNHSPFKFLDKYGEYDMSTTLTDCSSGICEEIVTNYLYNTAVGNYIMSSHYADKALGDFIKYINESNYFNDTVFVFYGDHDAKLSQSQINYLYNYDPKTGELKSEDDPTYVEYDYYDHELNKNTPLIIWTKNAKLRSKLNGKIDYVMGMYDVSPTINNMLGIKNDFALGHDIFNIKNDNVVVYPNGNFTTNLVYYNNSTSQYKILEANAELSSDYISVLKIYSEKLLEVSNGIIIHDLIKNEGNIVKTIKENGG